MQGAAVREMGVATSALVRPPIGWQQTGSVLGALTVVVSVPELARVGVVQQITKSLHRGKSGTEILRLSYAEHVSKITGLLEPPPLSPLLTPSGAISRSQSAVATDTLARRLVSVRTSEGDRLSLLLLHSVYSIGWSVGTTLQENVARTISGRVWRGCHTLPAGGCRCVVVCQSRLSDVAWMVQWVSVSLVSAADGVLARATPGKPVFLM